MTRAVGGKRGRYDSVSMSQRRERLVEASLSLLLEGRGDSFTLRHVAKLADVSLTVLYASFGSKEGLVAAAVRTFYSRQPQAKRVASTDLEGVLREIGEAAQVTLSYPTYVRSLCDLYFLHDGRNDVYSEIQSIARDTFLPWLNGVKARGELLPVIPQDTAERLLVSDRWHAISDWVNGHTPAEELPDMIRLRFLIMVSGLTVGETRRQVGEALDAVAKRLPFETQPKG